MDIAARALRACRRLRDAIALPWEVFCRPTARTRKLPHGSRRPARTAAAESSQTSRDIPIAASGSVAGELIRLASRNAG